jgi:DNA-directed RNA polymerase specialized sigma24 family protein
VSDVKNPAQVSQLVEEASKGKEEAMAELLPVVYGELRRVAAGYLRRERPGQTLQATALVHEAYLRLLREQHVSWQNRAHFCAIAANSMRQILVERARARNAAKRGGGFHRITLDDALSPANLHAQAPGHAPAAGVQGVDIEALSSDRGRSRRRGSRKNSTLRTLSDRYFRYRSEVSRLRTIR